jgi:hypothetical protein
VQVGLPEAEGTRPLKDFFTAAATVSPGFTDYWQNRIIDGDGTDVDFYGLINKLRKCWAGNTTRGTAVNHGAFVG